MGSQGGDTEQEVERTLRNTRRRYTVFYLQRNGGEASLEDVVDRVTEWENNGKRTAKRNSRRKSVYSSLYQRHLPKLMELGIITYDRNERTVSLTEAGERISLKVPTHDHDCRSFSRLFIGLGGLSAVVLAFGALEVVSDLFTYAVVSVSLTAVLVLASVQFYDYLSWREVFERKGPDYVVEVEEEL